MIENLVEEDSFSICSSFSLQAGAEQWQTTKDSGALNLLSKRGTRLFGKTFSTKSLFTSSPFFH